ncbi:hypothetical protein DFH09DRAFT_1489961 [Mycena vulgaris]|nr:hypothetical protein DFH09DRAFT_1489961 [Mycena vulgaris]
MPPSTPTFLSPIQDISPFTEPEDRIKWNQEWEKEIAWDLSSDCPLKPIDIVRELYLYISAEESEAEMQHLLTIHRDAYGQLCQSLTRLAQAVAVCYATHDFVNKWLLAPESVRQEYILEGLVRACRGSGIESSRRFCSELTLPFLQRDGGQGFLDLLKHFTLEDFPQVPKEPIYLESQHWHPVDPAAEPRATYELADAEFNLQRSCLIGMWLFELPYIKHETPGAQRFMRCKPCMENVSRKLYYCSRQCQREDWKLRHKRICGKAMTLKESEETPLIPPKPSISPSATPTPKITPPINGFKRSPALVYQINLLNENMAAGTDYILVTRTQRVFRLKVDDANEKRAAVAAIGQFLIKPPGGAVAMFGGSTAALGGPIVQLCMDHQDAFDQLEREYGFDVKSAVKALERKRGHGLTEVEKQVFRQEYPSW